MPKDRARRTLLHQARTVSPTSCGDLATRLELEPPHTIHRVTQALESLMAEDVAAGPTLLAALCMSRSQQSLHARGFFTTEQAERDFAGDPGSPHEPGWHEGIGDVEDGNQRLCAGRVRLPAELAAEM